MKNLIDLSDKAHFKFTAYVGQGKINASLVFFGNEPGISGLGIEDTIEHLEKCKDKTFLGGEEAIHKYAIFNFPIPFLISEYY